MGKARQIHADTLYVISDRRKDSIIHSRLSIKHIDYNIYLFTHTRIDELIDEHTTKSIYIDADSSVIQELKTMDYAHLEDAFETLSRGVELKILSV
jgi:hypothetical protein